MTERLGLSVRGQETRAQQRLGLSVRGRETRAQQQSVRGRETRAQQQSVRGRETRAQQQSVRGRETRAQQQSVRGRETRAQHPGQQTRAQHRGEEPRPHRREILARQQTGAQQAWWRMCYGIVFFLAPLVVSGCGESPKTSPNSTSPAPTGATAESPRAPDQPDSPPGEPSSGTPVDEQESLPTTPAEPDADLAVDETITVTLAPPQPADAPAPPADAPPARADAPPAQPVRIELWQPLHEPQAIFSERHAETNRVGVGDLMPERVLPDLNGKPRVWKDLLGERMTVVVFWTTQKLFAEEQYSRLNWEVVEPFRAAGVQVIAINVRDSPTEVQALAERYGTAAVTLLDEGGEAFGQVAEDHLPRTYLLDSAGKILWFDIEYSRSTRGELRNAVVYYLQQAGLLAPRDG